MENKRNQKRQKKVVTKKTKILFVIFFVIICALVIGAYFIFNNANKSDERDDLNFSYNNEFSVTYLNVRYGDATIIRFSNGKIMMIDTGSQSEENYNLIEKALYKMGAEKIDYLILSNPNGEHIGNALKILENKKVNKLFIPKIYDYSLFNDFKAIVDKAKELNVETEISCIGVEVEDVDANVFFLAPRDESLDDSIYQKMWEEQLNPSEQVINDLSPTVYIEYKGIRFLFSGDGGKSVEETVSELYKSNLYDDKVVLESIDFYKVSNHGKGNANTQDYLNLLLAKNAVISTGGGNYASLDVVTRINNANENTRILRTDNDGSIVVSVSDNGRTEIITDND